MYKHRQCIKPGIKNLSLIVRYDLYYSLMSCKQTRVIKHDYFIHVHISGIANNAVSFSGVVTILNNKESSKIYFSANVATF